MTHQAYRNTQRITEDARDTEYRLFGQVTGALIDAQQKGSTGGVWIEAGPVLGATAGTRSKFLIATYNLEKGDANLVLTYMPYMRG